MPLFLAPTACLAIALVLGAEARSTSALAERAALRCADRLALLAIFPSLAAGLVLDARWSLLGLVTSPAIAAGVGLTAGAGLAYAVSAGARVASRSEVPPGTLRVAGFVCVGASALVVVALGIARGATAVLPGGGAAAALAAALILVGDVAALILALEAAVSSRPRT